VDGAIEGPIPTPKLSLIASATKSRLAARVAAALPRLRGAFALAFLFDGEENLLIGAGKRPPLAAGWGSVGLRNSFICAPSTIIHLGDNWNLDSCSDFDLDKPEALTIRCSMASH
jgi:hypothetical protein